MDVPYFLRCFSLPPSDPESIHPCLLNACYLAACAGGGPILATLQPFFIQRTRHFLNQALMYADRILHFLWASIVLTCHLARRRRLDESYAIISSAAHFASACGLTDGIRTMEGVDYQVGERLLPPPKDETEAIGRIRLAYSLYITDHSLAALAAYPATFSYDEKWASRSGQREIMKDRDSKVHIPISFG